MPDAGGIGHDETELVRVEFMHRKPLTINY